MGWGGGLTLALLTKKGGGLGHLDKTFRQDMQS